MTGPNTELAAIVVDIMDPAVVPAMLAAAIDQARAAVAEFGGAETVGDHLGVDYEDTAAATHRFAAHLPGYQGWQWAVVVAASPDAAQATISEVVLVPGAAALLAPEWVPWDQRIGPGDLGPGDLLAPRLDDSRLVPGYTASGDPEIDDVARELGLGRRWVMSLDGRLDAAQRWHDGEFGPDSPMARSTKRACRDCGFFIPLSGALGTMFGVCGNAMSADGRVVDAGYGCGAHTDTPAPALIGSPAYEPYDDGVLEVAENVVAVADLPAPVDVSEPDAEASTDAEAPAHAEASADAEES